jgi:hypothetical protein
MGLVRVLSLFALLSLPCLAARALPGDVNGDGSVTIQDSVLAARTAARVLPVIGLPSGPGDVTSVVSGYRDGTVDWRDVALITRAAAGLDAIPDTPLPQLGIARADVSLTADATQDLEIPLVSVGSLPSSLPVSGHVGSIPEGVKDPKISFIIVPQSLTDADIGPDGSYATGLSPATYGVYAGGTVVEPAAGGAFDWQYRASVGKSVTVSGPTTLDADAAPPPLPGELTGRFSSKAFIPTSVMAVSRPQAPIWALGLFSHGVVSGNTYRLKAFPTDQDVTFGAVSASDPSQSYSFEATWPVNLSAGITSFRDVDIPDAAPVSLEYQPPAGVSVDSASVSMDLNPAGLRLSTKVNQRNGSPLLAATLPVGSANITTSLQLDSPPRVQRALSLLSQVTVPAGGGNIPIDLSALPTSFATLQGTVTYPDGSPGAGLTVTIEVPSSLRFKTNPVARATVTTDVSGHYAADLPAGRYGVVVSPVPGRAVLGW